MSDRTCGIEFFLTTVLLSGDLVSTGRIRAGGVGAEGKGGRLGLGLAECCLRPASPASNLPLSLRIASARAALSLPALSGMSGKQLEGREMDYLAHFACTYYADIQPGLRYFRFEEMVELNSMLLKITFRTVSMKRKVVVMVMNHSVHIWLHANGF